MQVVTILGKVVGIAPDTMQSSRLILSEHELRESEHIAGLLSSLWRRTGACTTSSLSRSCLARANEKTPPHRPTLEFGLRDATGLFRVSTSMHVDTARSPHDCQVAAAVATQWGVSLSATCTQVISKPSSEFMQSAAMGILQGQEEPIRSAREERTPLNTIAKNVAAFGCVKRRGPDRYPSQSELKFELTTATGTPVAIRIWSNDRAG